MSLKYNRRFIVRITLTLKSAILIFSNHNLNIKFVLNLLNFLYLQKKDMSQNNKKQFGVWMDSHHATIVGKSTESGEFTVIGHVKSAGPDGNSNENAANNQQITLTQKFFKEIAAKMVNIDEVHVTGTGQVQEQFIKFLADTAQYKNAVATHCTSNKTSDENFVLFVEKHFN